MIEKIYSPPGQDTHFLVTGGGKGITAENAAALAEAYQCKFTLVGRSDLLQTDPDWSVGAVQEGDLKKAALAHYQETGQQAAPRKISQEVNRILSSREIKQTLDRIARAGGTAEYVQADITDPAQLEEKLAERLVSVNALLHGAGALADKLIEDKSERDFDLVYGVKVVGLSNILEILPLDQLDFIILFSSVAGFYGNAGQADYSLGNEILNKLAHHLKRQDPSCQVLSIDWGPWDGGMVTPQLKRILNRKKIDLISLEEGTQALVDLVSRPQPDPQFVVGSSLPYPPAAHPAGLNTYRIRRRLVLENNPFLRDHVIGGRAVLPTVCAVAWFVDACLALYPGYAFHSVADYRVFKGIVFEDEVSPDYVLELSETAKSAEQISFLGKISSQDEAGNQRFHYQAGITLRKSVEEQPRLGAFNLAASDNIPGKNLYQSNVLFHGPCFQGVQNVLQISSTGLTTACFLPRETGALLGQFPVDSFNPLLADVHLQSLLIWAHYQLGSIGLPLQIKGAVQYKIPPLGETTYATMRVVSTSQHKLVANVTGHDSEGNIYTAVQDAEITLNKNLYALFQDNQLEKEPV